MKTIVEILVDNSNSMGPWKEEDISYLLPDGSTRMSLARKILKEEFIPLINYASKINIKTFHDIYDEDKDIELLTIKTIYEGDWNQKLLEQTINDIKDPDNTGGTPITGAIKESIKYLTEFEEWDRKIILVTDGEETGGGDYREAAKEAVNLYGIECNIFVVGIQQSRQARRKAATLAKETKGGYVNLIATNYDKEIIQNNLRPLKAKIVNQSVEKFGVQPPTNLVRKPRRRSSDNLALSKQSQPNLIKETKNLVPDNIVELRSGDNDLTSNDIKKTNQDRVIEQIVHRNSEVLQLINKQISFIQEDINDLKNIKTDYKEGDEITIHENEEEQKRVGRKCEEYLNDLLREKYGDRLDWLNEEEESGESYDFIVVDIDDAVDFYIECKGTKNRDKVFYMTKSEWSFFLQNSVNYRLYFVRNIDTSPEVIKIDNLLNWILKGKVVPYSDKNRVVKKERVMLTIPD